MMNSELLARIKLMLIPGIGPTLARHLITYADSAENLFRFSHQDLLQIPGLGTVVSKELLKHKQYESRAEDELKFIDKHGVKVLEFDQDDFPYRLNQCDDGPLMLFTKGNMDLNAHRMISVVGTRKATSYGKNFIEELCELLQPYQIKLVSGLAYGTDIHAHKSCLKNNIPTYGVVAHGLDRLYPAAHKSYAKEMLKNEGGLITEFLCNTNPDRENFPKRNRIIAGLCDATIVTEAAEKGGALITGNLAFDYGRDVFALPGKRSDEFSKGCNRLIKSNKAQLLDSVEDLVKAMDWEELDKGQQLDLFVDLNEQEKKVIDLLRAGKSFVDDIGICLQMSFAQTQAFLFQMEMNGWIRQIPGNRVELRR